MAQRSGFDGVLLSSVDGLPMFGIECTVFNANGSEATIYAAKTGNALLSNPVVTNIGTGGIVKFWVAPGYYEIEAVDVSETPARITPRRIPFNAIAGDVQGIDLNQLPVNIPGSQLQDLSVGAGKIENLALGAGKVKTGSYYASGVNSATVSGIPPGKYFGILTTNQSGKNGPTVTSGTATIQTVMPVGAQVAPFLLNVTATCSVGFSGTGGTSCGIVIYGINN
jgi:hypothetical protein